MTVIGKSSGATQSNSIAGERKCFFIFFSIESGKEKENLILIKMDEKVNFVNAICMRKEDFRYICELYLIEICKKKI
jgi:hypothetical protein